MLMRYISLDVSYAYCSYFNIIADVINPSMKMNHKNKLKSKKKTNTIKFLLHPRTKLKIPPSYHFFPVVQLTID